MAERADSARLLRAATSTPLFGRDAELATIRRALDDPSVRLLCLTGRGGVGKTRLACEIARLLIEDGATPTTFVPLVGVGDEALVLSAIAAGLGLPSTSKADPADLVAARLGSDDHVLILDNLEHVIAVAPQLDDLLHRCPGLQILGTSQAPLRLRTERVVRLEPLPVPELGAGGAAVLDPTQPAVATYLAAAHAAHAGFEPDPREARWVIELCRRLEGLPLAIELAGARAAALRPEAILRCLDEVGIAAISRPRSDAPARHHDLRAAISWTFDLLPPAERELLAVLSVGAGTFTLDTVLAAGDGPPDEVIDRFASLVDLHLVEVCPFDARPASRVEPAGCYVIATSIREFALGAGQPPGGPGATRRRFVRACAALAGPAADEIEAGVTDVPLAAQFDDGLASALQVAIEDELVDDALDILRVLAERWDTRGYHQAHEALVERCLALAAASAADPIRRARAEVWSVLAGLRHTSSRTQDELLDRLREAEAVGERLGDDLTVIWALTVTMLVSPITGDLDAAARAAARGLELAERPANRRALNAVRVWAGMVASQQGEWDRAVELGRLALDDARASGDPGALAQTALLLGPLVDAPPELAAQVPSTEEALDLARRAGQPFYEAIMLVRLVAEAVGRGDRVGALERCEESLLMARSMIGSPLMPFHLIEAISALSIGGDDAGAAQLLGVLRPVLPFLDAHEPPARRAARDALVDRIRATLGDEQFEALVARGSTVPWPDAVELALDSVREARGLESATEEAAAEAGSEAGSEEHQSRVATGRRGAGDPEAAGLTARQAEVLRLLATGMTNKDIAVRLGVSAKTVMHHTVAIYRALGVSGRSEATAWAFASGFLDGDEPSAARDRVR